MLLTSCADSWPDALDPSDWYATSVGEEAAPTSDQPVPGSEEDYPNLADVPEAPTNVSSPEEIDQVAQSLAADLANAQYTTDLRRADDETTPEPMPLPQPEVAEVVTETTYIEPGGEIDIAEAESMPVPAPEVEAEVVTEEIVAVAVAEMEQTQLEPAGLAVVPVTESRVETETIRGDDGELVGTVTRVVVSQEVAVTAEPVVVEPVLVDPPVEVLVEEPVAVLEAPAMEPEVVVEAMEVVDDSLTMVMAAPPAEPVAAEAMVVPAEVAEVAVAPVEVVAVQSESAMPAASQDDATQGQSLVAQSERSDTQIDVVELPAQVVVVPEYAAELAAAQVEPVVATPSAAGTTSSDASTAEAAAMATTAAVEVTSEPEPMVAMVEPAGMVAPGEIRVEQQTVVDNSTGDLVGSVTRTVEVVKVVEQRPVTPSADEIVVVEEPGMTFTEVAETLEPAAQPVIAPAVTSLPTVAVEETRVVTVPAETLDFGDLLSASGPGAGTAEQPIVLAEVETAPATQAAFTTVGLPTAETLAAIIRFGDGSSALGATERDIVRQLAAIHSERGGQIRLVGHASRPAGSMETSTQQLVNFNISLDRATAVAEELIRQGVPRNEVVVEAAGDNQASADAAQDRRVDVLFGA